MCPSGFWGHRGLVEVELSLAQSGMAPGLGFVAVIEVAEPFTEQTHQ
jgi:hypothetical protein